MVAKVRAWPPELARRIGCHLQGIAEELGQSVEEQRSIAALGSELRDAAENTENDGTKRVYVTVSKPRMLSR